MTYPNKEKRCAAAKDRQKRFLMQARIYDNAGSFEEYVVKCAACCINRRIFAFGFVDPFWLHYKVCDIGLIKIALRFAAPLMFAGCVTMAVLSKITAAPMYMNVIGGSLVGAVIWPICLHTVKNIYRAAESLLYDAHVEERGIKV